MAFGQPCSSYPGNHLIINMHVQLLAKEDPSLWTKCSPDIQVNACQEMVGVTYAMEISSTRLSVEIIIFSWLND